MTAQHQARTTNDPQPRDVLEAMQSLAGLPLHVIVAGSGMEARYPRATLASVTPHEDFLTSDETYMLEFLDSDTQVVVDCHEVVNLRQTYSKRPVLSFDFANSRVSFIDLTDHGMVRSLEHQVGVILSSDAAEARRNFSLRNCLATIDHTMDEVECEICRLRLDGLRLFLTIYEAAPRPADVPGDDDVPF